MRILLVLVLAHLAIAGPAQAQSWFTYDACTVNEPAIDPRAIDAAMMGAIKAEAAEIENGLGRLWQVTSSKGAVSFLWGTMHSTGRLILDLPTELEAIIENSRVVMPEISPVIESREGVAIRLRGDSQWATASDFGVYRDLDPRVIPWIDQRIRALGFQDNTLSRLTPVGILNFILAHPCDDFTTWRFPIQDDRIVMLSHEADAQIVGLERVEDFEKLNEPEHRETAFAIIEQYGAWLAPEDVHAKERSAYALYLQGRIAEWMAWDRVYLRAFFGAERAAQIIALSDAFLLWNRNLSFVRAAKPELDVGKALIVVGAFHLPGKLGMVSLFRGSGYRVERVPLPGEAP